MFTFEQETEQDWWEIEGLFDLSFAPGREALSSYRLRGGVSPVAGLCHVARNSEDVLVGAIRYWPIRIGENNLRSLLLGPVAVHPTTQGEGLGGALIQHTMNLAKQDGWERIILIGDFAYYNKFGFNKAVGVSFPPPTNPDRLLICGLTPDALVDVQGAVKAEN